MGIPHEFLAQTHIDTIGLAYNNSIMSTEIQRASDVESLKDLESLIASAAAGRPVDPAVAARVQERSAAIREHLPETDIAVELIRDARDP